MKLFLPKITIFSKKINIEWTFLFLALCLVVAIILSYTKEMIFPLYYFSDSELIQSFIDSNSEFTLGDSYESTAAFYSFLSIGKDSLIFPLISAVIISFYYLYCFYKSKFNVISIVNLSILIYCYFLSILYSTIISKDFIVILIMILFVFFMNKGAISFLVWLMIALIYSCYFRHYWFLVIFDFIILYMIFSYIKNIYFLLFTVVMSLLCLILVFNFILNVSIDYYRLSVNEFRIDSSAANTLIYPFIDGDNLLIQFLNIIITLFALTIPFPLLLLGTFFHLINFFMISTIFVKFIRTLQSMMVSKDLIPISHKKYICFIVSFITIQTIFEPDYGSYIRHLTPIFPLMIVLMNRNLTTN